MKFLVGVLVLMTTGFAFGQEPGSKIYIPQPESNQTLTDGNKVVTTTAPAFNLVLQSEIFQSKLPLQIVADASQADYIMQWAAIPEEGRAGYHLQFGGGASSKELYTVSASLLTRDKQVVWAGSVDKKNLHDSAADIAGQLKAAMKHKK